MTVQIRSHEIMDFKRCQTKWYWHWRLGLAPKQKKFGALDLGTWVHEALAAWYDLGRKRYATLGECFEITSDGFITTGKAEGAPSDQLEKAYELRALGYEMCKAYEAHYAADVEWRVIAKEVPLEFTFPNGTIYKLKPDLIFMDNGGDIWLGEHKTAAQIRTGHLVIDGQARPYGVLAERSLKKLGILKPNQSIRGIMYNYLRKAVPDDRPRNAQGQSLNKNGSVSARQPTPTFKRVPVYLTESAKRATLARLESDVARITNMTNRARAKQLQSLDLMKTPDKSCEKICDYFAMCVQDEEGKPLDALKRNLYRIEDPYAYGEDSAEEYKEGFEFV